nr:adenylate/guanylate cyclase domain-containing protein [Mycolicibacterium komanii]CRL67940.1 adenylyl cyclase class-3/4/guanylyl cyclase [Mycolicibacterium komanii]
MDGARCGSCGADAGATAKFCSECGTPLASATRTAEYKQVTVLFADVVRSMDIARTVGAERLREIMADLVDVASSVVHRYGGMVDKFTGDGIMAIFGAPVALEDHATRGCLAALGIQYEAQILATEVHARDGVNLQLRIGLDSGQVIAGEVGSRALGYTAVGEHVGMAQRMESVAPPGGVMLSASTARLVEGVATLDDAELVRVKGSENFAHARRLLGLGQERSTLRTESALVGRRWELLALEGLLDRAIAGQGAVVGISGSAGVGKSRLTRELAAISTHRSVPVVAAYCESHTSQVPFHVVKKLFRSAVGVDGLDHASARALIEARRRDVDDEDQRLFEDFLAIAGSDVHLPQIDPDTRRRRLSALVNAATLAMKTPAVYVVEDVHWVDEASESMLADLLAVIPQTPLLTVITYRPDYQGGLARVPGAQTFALAPLSDSETTRLVEQLLGDDPSVRNIRELIVERSAGTPFFAEEIVLELVGRGVLKGTPGSYFATAGATEISVPATLHATIASRIDRLPPEAKRTLHAAAVIGSRFSADLLTALGVQVVIDDLLAAQLIGQVTFGRHPEYAFRQPMIRSVAYEAQLRSDRAELHRRVATALEQQSEADGDASAALIAEHLESAGDLPAAYAWHMRAGMWSNNRDVVAARLSWERACQVADALPIEHPQRIAMRIAPRTALRATDWRVHMDDGGVRFAELRTLCEAAGDKQSLALAMMGPMAEHAQRGEVHEAQQLASEQLHLLDSIGDPALTAQAAFGSIGIKFQSGDMEAVRRWAETTITWAEGDPVKGSLVVGSPLAVAMGMRGLARQWFGRSGWRKDLDDAVALAEQRAESLTIAMVMSWKFGTGIWNGVFLVGEAPVCMTERLLSAAEASRDDYAAAMLTYLLGCMLLRRGAAGDTPRGVDLLTELRGMLVERHILKSELPIIDVYLGRERARAGDLDGAITTLRSAWSGMTDAGQVGYYIAAASTFVETLLDRGTEADLAEAETVITRLAAAPAEGSVIRDIWLLRMRALSANARGDDNAYRELRQGYREMADNLGYEGHQKWAAALP